VTETPEPSRTLAADGGTDVFIHLKPLLWDLLCHLAREESRTPAQVMRSALVAYSQRSGRS
jgi:hypothetical protein